MSSIQFVCHSGEKFTISGIGEGKDQGRIEIRWEGRTVTLVSLSIERLSFYSFHNTLAQTVEKISKISSYHVFEVAPQAHGVPVATQPGLGKRAYHALRVIPPLPRPLIEGSLECQWVVLHTLLGPLVFDRMSLLQSLTKERGVIDEQRLMAVITTLLQPLISNRPVLSAFNKICSTDLRRILQTEIEGVVKHSMPREQRRERQLQLYARAEQTIEWMDRELQECVQRSPWTVQNWMKVRGIGFPIRCVKDLQTGKVVVEITVGVFEGGADKAIKSVILIDDGKIQTLAHLSPRKSSPFGDIYSEQERREILLRLQREVFIADELVRGDVPNIMGFVKIPYLNECRVKYRYMMPRCAETLVEYDRKMMAEDPFEKGQISSPHLSDILSLHLQVIDSLRHMHRLNWVHRDVKPENILIHQRKAVLIDFGFSQQIGEKGGFVGAPGYIAPEQLSSYEDQEVSSASDIWSFGIMLYYASQVAPCSLEEIQLELAKKIQSFHAAMLFLAKRKDEELAAVRCQRGGEAQEQICQQYRGCIEKMRCSWMEQARPYLETLETKIEMIREGLHDETNPLKILLRNLLSLHPAERLSAQDTYDRLSKIIASK